MRKAKTREEILEESVLYKKENEEILDAFRKRNKRGQNPFYLKVKCVKHSHAFDITWHHYKEGKGCKKCGIERSASNRTKSKKEAEQDFIDYLKLNESLIKVYQKRDYRGKNVWWATLFCKKCNTTFEIRRGCHKLGIGCAKCGTKRTAEQCTLSPEQVIKDFTKQLKSNEIIIKVYQKKRKGGCNEWWATLKCLKHGKFNISKNNHKAGNGCLKCSSSKGEAKIRKYLLDNNITFEEQYKFENCKYYKPLPFDFYIPSLNMTIEYQGEQHYKPIKVFGGNESFQEQQKRDKIKKEYCQKNNIQLLEIPYTEYSHIEKILNEKI